MDASEQVNLVSDNNAEAVKSAEGTDFLSSTETAVESAGIKETSYGTFKSDEALV